MTVLDGILRAKLKINQSYRSGIVCNRTNSALTQNRLASTMEKYLFNPGTREKATADYSLNIQHQLANWNHGNSTNRFCCTSIKISEVNLKSTSDTEEKYEARSKVLYTTFSHSYAEGGKLLHYSHSCPGTYVQRLGCRTQAPPVNTTGTRQGGWSVLHKDTLTRRMEREFEPAISEFLLPEPQYSLGTADFSLTIKWLNNACTATPMTFCNNHIIFFDYINTSSSQMDVFLNRAQKELPKTGHKTMWTSRKRGVLNAIVSLLR